MGKKEKSENNVEQEQTSPQTTELTPKAIFLFNEFQSNVEELKNKWLQLPFLERNKLLDQLHELYRKIDKSFVMKELAARWVYAVKAVRQGYINDAYVEFADIFLFASKDPKLDMIRDEAKATLDILKDQVKPDEIERIKTAIAEGQTPLWIVKNKTQEEIGNEQLKPKEVEGFVQQFKTVLTKVYTYLKEVVPFDFRQRIAVTTQNLNAIPSFMKEHEFEQGALEILEARSEFYQGKIDSGTNRLTALIQNASLKEYMKDIVNESNEAIIQFQGQPALEPTVENVPQPTVENVPQPIIENVPQPTVENVSQPIVENVPQPIVENVPQPIVENVPQPQSPPPFQPSNIEPIFKPIQQSISEQKPAPTNIASIFSIPSTPATISAFNTPQASPPMQNPSKPVSIFSAPTTSIFSLVKPTTTTNSIPPTSIFSNPATPAPMVSQTPQYNPNQPNQPPQQYRPPQQQPQYNPSQPYPQPQYNPNQPNQQPQQYRPPQQPQYNPNQPQQPQYQPYQQPQYQPYQQPQQYRPPQQPQQYTPSGPSLFAKSGNRPVQQQPPMDASTTYRCPMCGAFVDRRIYSYCPVCNGIGLNPIYRK